MSESAAFIDVLVGEIVRTIEKCSSICVITGRRTSEESGLWKGDIPVGVILEKGQDASSLEKCALFSHPDEFFIQWFEHLSLIEAAQPTFLHLFLARLEQQGQLAAILTVNQDGLHQKAGNKKIHEHLGSWNDWRCPAAGCHRRYSLAEVNRQLRSNQIPPHCNCGGHLQPMVTLSDGYETLDTGGHIFDTFSKSDLVIVFGCDLFEYMGHYAQKARRRIIIDTRESWTHQGASVKLYAPSLSLVAEKLARILFPSS